MKRNTHFVVPASRFRFRAPLSSDSSSTAKDSSSSSSSSNSDKSNPWSQLTTYAFNTGVAKHHFCKTCGVVPFYQARSNPDGFAITVHCLEPGTVRQVEVRRFDGVNWESFLEGSGIQAFSKVPTGSSETE
jgi:hypothetical protein